MALEDEMRDVGTLLSEVARLLDTTNGLLIELIDARKVVPPSEPPTQPTESHDG